MIFIQVMDLRQEIVWLRDDEDLSERDIARLLEIPRATVHYWLAKEFQPPSTLKRGRPRVTDGELDEVLYHQSVEHPFQTAVDIGKELAPNISPCTVRRRLKDKGLRCRIPARKPDLNPFHIEKRKSFSQKYISWNVEDWQKVVFSDEKVFRSSSRGPLHVYRPLDSDRYDSTYLVPSTNVQGRHTVCVWLAFGWNVRRIHRIAQRTLNAEYYTTEVLPLIENELIQNDWIFMHDLSSIHTSRRTTQWLENQNIQVMDDWPPKGADMNPVENVWAELVRRIRNDSTNRDRLWENILRAFNELDDNYFKTLIQSMPRRIARVLEKEGRFTKY